MGSCSRRLGLEYKSIMLKSDRDATRSPCCINTLSSDMVGPCVLLTCSILLGLSIRVTVCRTWVRPRELLYKMIQHGLAALRVVHPRKIKPSYWQEFAPGINKQGIVEFEFS